MPLLFLIGTLFFFCMDKHLLVPQLILKAQLIEAIAFMGSALDGDPRLVFGQLIRRQIGHAVVAARGDGLVGVAIQKADDQFLIHTRQGHGAPGRTGPTLSHTHPARTLVVVFVRAVPRELHFHPPPFIAAFFGGEAADEIKVGFTGLYAVFARLVLEADFAADVGQFLLGQHAGDDVGHGLALKNSPVGTQVETRQIRFDYGGVAGAAKAGVALLEQADQAVDVAHRGGQPPAAK